MHELELGDHVRLVRRIVNEPSLWEVCSFCSKRTLEVKDIITVDRARGIIDQFEEKYALVDTRLDETRAPDQDALHSEKADLVINQRLAKMLFPNGVEPEPNLCVFRLEKYIIKETDRHTSMQTLDDQQPGTQRHSVIISTTQSIVSCADGSLPSSGNTNQAAELRRVNSYGWSMTVMSLAFLDWFHVVFNLVNLSFMYGQFTEFDDDVMTRFQRARNERLCILCIGIYLVRVVVQPVLLLWHGRRAFTTEATFSEVWHENLRWYTTMCFNTLMMLPAMMLVNSPFRDSGKSVRDAYVKIGAQVAKDYQAGLILLLMVFKKTINGYLVVSWLIANEARKERDGDDAKQTEYAQFISMGLLIAHLIVTLYVMMAPKLAHSQNGSVRWGCFLLSVALLDWLCLLTNALSLIDVYQHETDGTQALAPDDIPKFAERDTVASTVNCAWQKHNVLGVSIAAGVLFFMRVLAQLLAFFYLRRVRGPLNRRHLNVRTSTDMTVEGTAWRRWSDEFQALTFNSWMMTFALLFIEKPYRPNLLSSGDQSPFRRKLDIAKGCDGLTLVALIYAIVVFKKLCLIYVNVFKLKDDCFHDGEEKYGNAVSTLALVFTALHSLLWFYSFRQMGVCETEDDLDPSPYGDDVFPPEPELEEPAQEEQAPLDDVAEGSYEGTTSSSGGGSSLDRRAAAQPARTSSSSGSA